MKFLKLQYYRLLILMNYIRVFGTDCFRVYFRLRKKRNTGIYGVFLKKYARTVYLRAETTDIHSFEQVLVNRDYLLKSGIPVKNIIDAGANAGYASIFFSHYYPGAKIIALEPEESNCEIIRKNMEGIQNFHLEPCALWDKMTQLGLLDENTSKWSFRFSEEGARKYQAVDMPYLFDKYSIETLDLCKIDIEGGEREVFASPGADWWLQKTKVLFIELHERFCPGTEEIFFACMQRNAFHCRISGENILALNTKLINV